MPFSTLNQKGVQLAFMQMQLQTCACQEVVYEERSSLTLPLVTP
jgi:hypothetical protein